jgi:MYXO-CTERM domain-containing protein
MRKLRLLSSLGATGILAAAAAAAQAGTITFTNTQVDESGTGFGSVLNLLTVQATGGGTTEYGEVTWNGSSDVDNVGDTQNTSETRSVADIFGATGNTDIGIIFNINQQGSDTSLILNDFQLLVFSAAGVLLDSINFDAGAGGLHLDIDQQGTGGAGWLFRVSGLGSLINTSTNRFGMRILSTEAITQVNDGPENFYITSIPGTTTTTAMPLPPAALIGLLTLSGVGLAARLRRRRTIV